MTINASGLAKVIFNIVIHYNNLSHLIVIDRDLLFTFKFLLLFCYFLGIKRRLFTAFYPQTDNQTKPEVKNKIF